MTLRILLPLDGTELSLHQVRFAIRLCESGLQAEFVAANVQEPASFYEVITARDPSRLDQIVQAAAQDLVAPAVQLLVAADLPHEVTMVQEDDPVQGMLELIESEGCDLVIIGAHASSLLEGRGAQSSALRLARVSPVPVLSVKAPPPPDHDRDDDA